VIGGSRSPSRKEKSCPELVEHVSSRRLYRRITVSESLADITNESAASCGSNLVIRCLPMLTEELVRTPKRNPMNAPSIK